MSKEVNKYFPRTTRIDGASFKGKQTQQAQHGQWGAGPGNNINNTGNGVNATEATMIAKIDSHLSRQFRHNAKVRAQEKNRRRKEHQKNERQSAAFKLGLMERLGKQLGTLLK